ncbi:MAG: sigma-70 family RNA polymerase sigma factor [Phycisphaerales bacterium]|nr:MAG: sigma-70 family RNA polymerase sigma factor [Phycisphaerales bacterium]
MDDSKNDLVVQHQDYVVALARNIAKKLPAHVEIEDLIGFGQLGLVEAANRYDFRTGVSFETFAYRRIRGAIFDGLRKMTWLPPGARSVVKFESGVDATAESLGEGAAASDDPEILAKNFRQALRSLGAVFLLSQEDEAGEGLEPAEHTTPDQQAEQRELISKVRKAVERLDEKQQTILKMHYFEGQTLTDCAKALGHHKAWVSRLHASALEQLHKLIEAPLPG